MNVQGSLARNSGRDLTVAFAVRVLSEIAARETTMTTDIAASDTFSYLFCTNFPVARQ